MFWKQGNQQHTEMKHLDKKHLPIELNQTKLETVK